MSAKLRDEIEAKRAKLQELRQARLNRQKYDSERRLSIVSRISSAGSDRASLGAPPVQSATDTIVDRPMTPRFIPDLIDIQQELFELPQRERVTYNKEIQTADIESSAGSTPDEEVKEPIFRERETTMDPERTLEEESATLDREIEEETRDLTEEERTSIIAAPEFLDFVEQSSKIVQRALNDNYDYIRDYTSGAETGGDDSEGKRVKCVCAFWDERYCKNRSITDVDWSPKFPELSVASYNKNAAAVNEPDGIVAVWNLHLLERPEFVFHSQSDVLSVTFSPFHANLVFGGTYSGQILLWDTRSKHLPVLKTPLSAAGHTHPVYAMQMVGTQNAHNLITSSTDGMVCSWLVDMLAQPQETLELVHAGHNKTGEVAITTLDFLDNETTAFWVGTEEGNVYQANRYDRAGAKAGLNQYDVYKGHSGPIMGLNFHPLHGPVDFSDLFLTCSVDWTVKLWRSKSLAKPSTSSQTVPPIYSFDEADDYVYDVKWHPAHPAVFASVDGSGKFDLWNLNMDTEVPVVSTTVNAEHALNKVQWDRKDGRRAILGGSEGRLYIYDIGDMAIPRETEWNDMQKTVAGFVGGQTSVEVDSSRVLATSANGRIMSSETGFKQVQFIPHILALHFSSTHLIPGPIEVLYANAHPSVSHMSANFTAIFGESIRMTREVVRTTTAQPFLISGSGTLGWDQVSANLVEPGESVLVLSAGYFGDSFADCLETYGAEVQLLRAGFGGTIDVAQVERELRSKKYKIVTITHVDTSTGVLSDPQPVADAVKRISPDTLVILDAVCAVASEDIQMDNWGIDVVISASQKGLGAPPGLSIVIASQKAMKVFETRSKPVAAYYASWKRWLPIMKAYEGGSAAYFATPPVNLIRAYHESLLQITKTSPSLDERLKRHRETSNRIMAAAAELGLAQLPLRPEISANGMTALWCPEGVKSSELLPAFLQKGVIVGGGLGTRKGIHMGITAINPERGDVDRIVNVLKEVISAATSKR
ncbi:Pyridoxal phosphate-dependent transferase [Russula decolorans]